MSFTYNHTFTLSATPERVFRALTSPGEITEWFSEHADVSATPGGRYHFSGKYTPESAGGQVITTFVPNESLAFSWNLHGVATLVTMTLAAREADTSLTLTHEFPGDMGIPRQREYIDDFWRLMMANLAAYLTTGRGVIRVDFTDDAPEVRHVITIDAPPADVFRALIEPESVNKWLGSKASSVEPRAGGKYDLSWNYTVDGRDVDGGPTRILEFVQDRKLVLDWRDWRGDTSVIGQTISFVLDPNADGGTTLTFVHAGFDRPADISDYGFGWTWFLDQLSALFITARS